MELNNLVNFAKSIAETTVEKALELVRSAEQTMRKATETYDIVADMLPFPLPKLGGEPYEAYEPPAAPVYEPPATVTPAPAKPAAKKAAPKKPAAKKAAPKKPAAKKAAPAKPAAKKAAPKKPAAKKAAPKKAATLPAAAALKKMKKADLQKLCRERSLSFKSDATNAALVALLLGK